MPAQSTRDRILEKADDLFYQGGFEATSFADIAATLGISRGNFYHHFKTKDEILDGVIDRRLAATRAQLDGWAAETGDPAARILCFARILVVNRAEIMAHGCPVGTLSAELAKLDHAAKERAAEVFALYRDWLAAEFRALGHEVRAEALALHLLGRVQGVAVMLTAFRDDDFLDREIAGIEAWLATLAGPRI